MTSLIPIILPCALLGAAPAQYRDHANLLIYVDPQSAERRIETPADWQQRRAHILSSMQLVMGSLPDDAKKVPLDDLTV